jgi:hypothetical protein
VLYGDVRKEEKNKGLIPVAKTYGSAAATCSARCNMLRRCVM